MDKKIISELQKYVSGLKVRLPDADHARVDQLLADLAKELETLDPTDPVREAALKGAGLFSQPEGPPVTGDAAADKIVLAAWRAAGLPEK